MAKDSKTVTLTGSDRGGEQPPRRALELGAA